MAGTEPPLEELAQTPKDRPPTSGEVVCEIH